MQLEMQRGGCGGTNTFVLLLGPPWVFGSPVCSPWCKGAGEHPWVLCIELELPQEPPQSLGEWGTAGRGHGWWHVLGIEVGVLPPRWAMEGLGAQFGDGLCPPQVPEHPVPR